MIRFDTTRKDAALIEKIARRSVAAASVAGWHYELSDAEMDLTAVHRNGCPLDLKRLLYAGDTDFSHDVFGIRHHLNRKTGALMDCFTPRHAKPSRARR